MRILVISPLFPPFADAEAICGAKFVQALIDSDVEASVICSSDVRMPAPFDGSKMWEPLRCVSTDVKSVVSTPKLERLWAAWKYQSTTWAYWTRTVVENARQLHRQKPFDMVISRSLPQHAHLAGYWVASGLGIPWIAIVNDPWDFSPFVAIEARRQEWTPPLNWRIWWRRIVARADAVCFPCERLRDFCLQGSTRKSGLFIVPHIGTVSGSARCANEFLIVHTGKLGVNDLTGRSAITMLNGLKELFRVRPAAKPRTRLVFVGPEDPATVRYITQQGLSENVTCTGLVSYEVSLDYIAQSSLCLLVEADVGEGIFLPSKLCDYIVARKPVLALSPEVGTVADLAAEGYIRRVKPNDSMAVAAALVELFDAFLASRLDSYAPPDSLVQRFEGKKVIQDFFASVVPLTSKETQTPRPHL
jgi:hypothetical protein